MLSNEKEFEALLAAHANRDIDPAAEARLLTISAGDPKRHAMVEDFDRLHATFDAERALRAAVLAPADPAEEADPVYRKLGRAAARAEEGILEQRHRLAKPPAVARWRDRRLLLVAVAAVLVAVLLRMLPSGDVPPPLIPGKPTTDVVGGIILVDTVLDRQDPVLSWAKVGNARSYEVRLQTLPVGGEVARVLFHEAKIQEPKCDLTPANLSSVPAGTSLELRITAQDSSGQNVATSGDLRVRVQ